MVEQHGMQPGIEFANVHEAILRQADVDIDSLRCRKSGQKVIKALRLEMNLSPHWVRKGKK